MGVTVIILTLNEARHIERALRSVAAFAERCIVVDSGSTDATVELARAHGAEVLTHDFVNQARQFNWALDQLESQTGWVLKLDADEVVSAELAGQILQATTDDHGPHPAGFTVARRMSFLGTPIRFGGVFPVHVLRLFRVGAGRSEDRWMDEHIAVQGQVGRLTGLLEDDNLNPLSWWIDKHNRYASREVLQMFLSDRDGAVEIGPSATGRQASTKRWVKSRLFARLPLGFGPLIYFLYRYVLRGGFRDGFPGLAFHALQGGWYRFLVDAKRYEMRRELGRNGNDLDAACREVLGLGIEH